MSAAPRRVAPGSHLVIGHGTTDNRPEIGARLTEASKLTPTPLTLRPRPQIERFLDGFDLVEPGLVWVPQWRPDEGVDPRPEAELADPLPHSVRHDAVEAERREKGPEDREKECHRRRRPLRTHHR